MKNAYCDLSVLLSLLAGDSVYGAGCELSIEAVWIPFPVADLVGTMKFMIIAISLSHL